MPSTEDWLTELGAAFDRPVPSSGPAARPEALAWARSGAMALTGRRDGPPLLSIGAPATAAQRCLDVVASCLGAAMPGLEVLGERAAAAGFTRNAPWSAGGAFRALRARDGWLGLTLARPSDLELVPALIEADRSADEWTAVGRWIAGQPVDGAAERAQLLGLAAAVIAPTPPRPTRPGVVVAARGGSRRRGVPLVVDLSALWAGPLCAHLLGLGGARVIKVESANRPDGARFGPPRFFDLLHAGHESLAIDVETDRELLVDVLRAADVVIESSRPRALRQWGIQAEDYVADGAIWVSITAYGRDDAHALRVGFGDDVAAGAGLVHLDAGEPWPLGDALADPLAGLAAAAAAALAMTATSGVLLDVSMHDVAATAAQPEAVADEAATRVQRSGDGWVVSAAGRIEAVANPGCRPPAGRAAELGRNTAALSSEFAR
jgi:crotonobetainyl-CoA:carnitine CoA-transferase CaiB-like acyl-CoA transferase